MLTNLHISELFTTFVMKLDDVSAEKSGILCTSFGLTYRSSSDATRQSSKTFDSVLAAPSARHFIASLLSLGIIKVNFILLSLTRRLVVAKGQGTEAGRRLQLSERKVKTRLTFAERTQARLEINLCSMRAEQLFD